MPTKKVVVDDPGFANGQVQTRAFQWKPYDIKIKRIQIEDNGTTNPANDEIIQIITIYPGRYWWVMGIYGALNVFLAGISILYGDPLSDYGWGAPLIFMLAVFAASSFHVVKETQRGGLVSFGKPVREVAGLVFAPLGFFSLRRLPKLPVQVQFPGDPEKIYKGSDEEYFKLPKEEQEKYVLPIRALTAPSAKKVKGEAGILETQMTIEVNFVVRWVIEQFWVFLIRVGSIDEMNRQLRDSGEKALIQAISGRTTNKVRADMAPINHELSDTLTEITQGLGVAMDEAAMLSPDITLTANKSLRDVVVAKADQAKRILAAEAERIELEKRGEGNAVAKQKELEALAAGAKALGLSPQEVLDLEKARAFGGGNTTVVVDGGSNSGSIVGLGAKLGAGMQATQNNGGKS